MAKSRDRMTYTRTFDLLSVDKLLSTERPLLFNKMGSGYEAWTGKKIISTYLSLTQFLVDQNIKAGEMVILMPESANIEWLLLDLAIQAMGGIVVMAHSTLSTDNLASIYSETESRFFFYQNPSFVEKHKSVLSNISKHHIEALHSENQMSIETYRATSATVLPTDISTIIYTSGTTGTPKGVMLSHFNIMSNVQAVTLLLPIEEKHRIISFLPFSHIFERSSLYCMLALRAQVYFIDSPHNLKTALPQIKPHYFTAVPRILERMYDAVVEEFNSRKWLGKKVFKWASKVAYQYKPYLGFNPIKYIQLRFIRIFLLGKFRRRLGKNLEAIMVGAAHLRPEIAKAFYAAGIKVREGYGMTETSPGISFNRFEPGMNRFGTVGLPLPNIELEIRDQDETGAGVIWVKGPNVMQGYYKRPEETKMVLTEDGWLNTGDVGMLEKGFLKITDRQKDIFKTSSGKYIAPQELESHFSQSDFIESLLIIGFQKPFVAALIYPNFAALKTWADHVSIHWTSPQYMVLNIKIKEKIQLEIDLLNKDLPKHKKIKAFYLMHEPWSIESGQLSNTLKPIRRKIQEDYEKELEEMYE